MAQCAALIAPYALVMRGLDPRIHLLCKTFFTKMDGLPGQGPAMTADGSVPRQSIKLATTRNGAMRCAYCALRTRHARAAHIHLLCKKFFTKMDGLPGQGPAMTADGSVPRQSIKRATTRNAAMRCDYCALRTRHARA